MSTFVVVVTAVSFFYSVKLGAFGNTPSKEELIALKNYEASEIYTSDSVLIGRYFLENRSNAKFENISPFIISALICTEDERFYLHDGVDKKSMFRVLVKSIILRDKSAGGGSTISQQLIKNLLGREDHGFLTMPVNKTKEAILARTLEETYSKNEILELYLNTVSFGENVFGIEIACERYFNSTPSTISPEQAAVLVGMLKAPSYYNPRTHPEQALRRRNTVLSQMRRNDSLTTEEFEFLRNKPLGLDYRKFSRNEGPAPYFRAFLKSRLEKHLKNTSGEKKYNLYTDGLKIYTTIDSKLQAYAEIAVKNHMRDLQQSFWSHLNGSKPWGKNETVYNRALHQCQRYKKLKASGASRQAILKAMAVKRKMLIYDAVGEHDTTLSATDSIIHYSGTLQSAFIAASPQSGKVLAWVGGINHDYFEYDHVNAQRQVGSTFKPIVYAAALQKGMRPCKYISNKRETYEEFDNWSPKNSNGKYEGAYTLKGGLTHSVNTISVKLLQKAGLVNVINLAKDLGIKSELPLVPSLSLGVADISLLEMIGAYTVFPNNGTTSKPWYVESIVNQKGQTIYTGKEFHQEVLSEKEAALMCNFMQSVVDNGTANRIRSKYNLKGEIAGKTGTTQSQADGWFMGFTPNLIAGVWVGADNPAVHFKSTRLGQGANMALPIWAKFYQQIYNDPQRNSFTHANFDDINGWVDDATNCDLYKDRPGEKLKNIFHTKPSSEKSQSKKGTRKLKLFK